MKKILLSLIVCFIALSSTITSTYANDEGALEEQEIDKNLINEDNLDKTPEQITDIGTIKIVQNLMNVLGYDCGTADGIIGEKTKNAVKDYQKSVGMTEDGIVSDVFVAFLYLDVRDRVSKIQLDADTVIDTWESNNSSCESAYQQAANGANRIYELLTCMALDKDNGSYKSEIADIRVEHLLQDLSASSALHQEVNGLYRAVEMACVLAKELDTAGKYTDYIDGVADTLESNNENCSTAPQQIVNGEYRMVEILQVIGYESDKLGAYKSVMDGVIDDLYSKNASCQSAPQQSANGTYRTVEMLQAIYYGLDYNKKLESYVKNINDSWITNDSNSTSALHQEVNGLYRSVELMYIIASLL